MNKKKSLNQIESEEKTKDNKETQKENEEKENNTLKHQLNSIQNKNIYDIDHMKNEMDLINIEYEKEKKQNQLLNDEKVNKNKEIIDLKTKLINFKLYICFIFILNIPI